MSRASTLPVLPSATHGYDANDRLTSNTYDPNGNTLTALLRDPVNGIPRSVADQYDFEDQLLFRQTTINGQPTEVLLAYDGDGNRVKKTVTTGSTSVSYFYVVDNLNPTGYAQVIEELQPVSGNPVQLAVYRAYTYGLQRVSQDQLVSNQWVASYYGYDGQGSVRFLTDASGDVTDTYDYDAFGNLIARTGNTPNVHLYRGEQYDAELGLYYLRARYANPETGRFWTADTFEGFADDPHSLHKYTFNHNDPVNRIDPSGHFSIVEGTAAFVIGGMSSGVVDNLFYGIRRFMAGSIFGADVLATSQAEARFIDSLTPGVGINIGKDNFWAVRKYAPSLLGWNPFALVDTCCFNFAFFDDDRAKDPDLWKTLIRARQTSVWERYNHWMNAIMIEYQIVIRFEGMIRILGGLGEGAIGTALAFAPEPALTKAGAVVFIVHAADELQSGSSQAWYGQRTRNLTTSLFSSGFAAAGASPASANAMAEGANAGIGLASAGVGLYHIFIELSRKVVLTTSRFFSSFRSGAAVEDVAVQTRVVVVQTEASTCAVKTAPETTRLWRAVEPAELQDVIKFGDYNIHANSTFKRFAFDEASLDAFIKANPDRIYTKTHIDILTSKLKFMYEHGDTGGVGRAIGIDVFEMPEFYRWFDRVQIK